MQVAFSLAGEITQVLDALPWVRCASGNVYNCFTILTIEKTILEICDIWDTDYSSDNWELEFMTIFGTWQLIVTLDSIRNSCDV